MKYATDVIIELADADVFSVFDACGTCSVFDV